MKTIKRNWLKKQIELGKVEAKCDYKMSDDYAFDNAYNFMKSDWLPARMSRPKFEPWTSACGSVIDRCVDHDFIEGQMNFKDYQFEGKSGGAYQNEDGTISFYIHYNESYTLRIKA